MAYYLLQFDTEKFFSPVGTIGTAWTASGWTAAAYEQTTTSAAASLPLDVFYAQMPNFGAINLVSHGAAGGVTISYYDDWQDREDELDRLVSGPPFDDWVRGIDFGPSSVDSPSGIKFGIKLYPSGIAKLPVRSDAFIVGVYCTSDQASSYWPGAGYWGFVGEACSAPQYVNKFWFRMGCGDEDCVEPNAGDAFEGGCHGTGVGGVLRTGSEEWSLNCVRGCEAWPTYLSAYGAFEDTVYCQYVTDGLESRLILHGYPTLGDYPNNGLALDTVTVAPGASRTVLTAMQVPSQMFLYEWQEIAALRTRDRSEAFAPGDRPSWWGLDEHAPLESEAQIFDEWTEPSNPGGGTSSSDSSECADFVVYAASDSLADPIRTQLQSDAPGRRVRVIIAPDAQATSCRAAIDSVLRANHNWNLWCAPTSCGRLFPENPGPELYIVGRYTVINAFAFDDTTGACRDATCSSDLLLYDINGDLRPEGPVARIPASTVAQVTAMAEHSHQFNLGVFVEPTGAIVTVAGGVDSGMYAERALDDVADVYVAMDIPRRAALEKREFVSVPEQSVKTAALSAALELGVAEQWWFGGHSNAYLWPGGFAYENSFPSTSREQRCVAWAPGCWTLNPGGLFASIAEDWLLDRGGGTRLASAVGNLDIGWDRFHATSLGHLRNARHAIQLDGVPRSVARVLYDAVLEASDTGVGPWTNALSLAAWGSFTVLKPHVNPVGDLTAAGGRTTAVIAWTEPGQPVGTASEYEIRYKADSPLNETNFTTGALADGPPVPGDQGTPHCMELSGLVQCRPYYFAMRTKHNGVWSRVGNVATATTKCSGSVIAMCESEGLLGGGGEGGESSRQRGEYAMEGHTELGARARDQTLLRGLPGESIRDVCRLGHVGATDDRVPSIRLTQTCSRRAELGSIAIGYVDRPEGAFTVAATDSVLVGVLGHVQAIEDAYGRSRSELREPGAIWAGRRGESLTIQLPTTQNRAALVFESRCESGIATSDSLGIGIEAMRGQGEWVHMRTVYPRRDFDYTAIPVDQGTLVRLTVRRDYVIRSVGSMAIGSVVAPTPLAVASATHSRLGAVDEAVKGTGGGVSLAASESLSIEFVPALGRPVESRDYFVTLTGTYELGDGRDGIAPQELQATSPVIWRFELAPAYPNPGSGQVIFAYTLAEPTRADLKVYDVAGRLVRTLVGAEQAAGPQEVVWDGRDSGGRGVAAGVYFYRLTAGSWHSQRKVVLLQR